MQTNALELARQSAITGQPECLSWGIAEFQVTDLDRTIAFWTAALGFKVRDKDAEWVALGTRTKTLFMFRGGASVPVAAQHTGLYHVAIGVPEQHEFSRLLARLIAMNIAVSPVDHLMSKAIYFKDPDGLEIEIAFETPHRFGRFGDMSQGLVLYDAEGHIHNGRAPLDVESELAFAQTADLAAPLSDDASIAHLHLKVSDLDVAAAWFEGIGFSRNLMLPNLGFADMGAGGAYTHRLGMNNWAGSDVQPAPSNMARLTRYALHVHSPAVMKNVQGLQPSELGLSGVDPAGTDLSLIAAF